MLLACTLRDALNHARVLLHVLTNTFYSDGMKERLCIWA